MESKVWTGDAVTACQKREMRKKQQGEWGTEGERKGKKSFSIFVNDDFLLPNSCFKKAELYDTQGFRTKPIKP